MLDVESSSLPDVDLPSPSDEAYARVVFGFGVVLAAAFVAEWIVFTDFGVDVLLSADLLVSLVVTGLFVFGVVYGAYRLETGSIPPERYPRAAGWCSGGSAGYLALNLIMIVMWPPEEAQMLFGWIRTVATIGAAGGLLVGIVEARAIERARAAEREAVRAEQAERQRDTLDDLNNLLRHEVLNAAQVIHGKAALLLAEGAFDDDHVDSLETIRRQSEDLTRVIEDVRTYLEAQSGDGQLRRVDVADVLRTELADVVHTYETVSIDVSAPDTLPVLADDLLPRVFSNLFANAVEHNDSDTPRIEVDAETVDGTIRIEIADNGPGIPDGERETLFERNERSNHGIGLHLVHELIGRYDGSIELADTGPDGTTFRVTLPLAGTADGRDSATAADDGTQAAVDDGAPAADAARTDGG